MSNSLSCLEKSPQVWCITGHLGGGKSLTAVSLAIEAMKKGFFVVSNIYLKQSILPRDGKLYKHIDFHWEEETPDGKTIEHFYDFHSLPRGTLRGHEGNKRVLVVLDEMAEWMDQFSNVRSEGLKRFFSWLRHSSKRGQDVILICQRRELLSKSARVLVSRWLLCEDLASARLPVFKCHLPFMSDYCLVRVFDRLDNIIKRPFLIAKSLYGKYYDTSQDLSGSGDNALEYELAEEKFAKSLYPYILLFVSWFSLFYTIKFF